MLRTQRFHVALLLDARKAEFASTLQEVYVPECDVTCGIMLARKVAAVPLIQFGSRGGVRGGSIEDFLQSTRAHPHLTGSTAEASGVCVCLERLKNRAKLGIESPTRQVIGPAVRVMRIVMSGRLILAHHHFAHRLGTGVFRALRVSRARVSVDSKVGEALERTCDTLRMARRSTRLVPAPVICSQLMKGNFPLRNTWDEVTR